jgi:hypothetical protein
VWLVLFVVCYYVFVEGDDLKKDNPTKAITLLERVVELETSMGETVKWLVHSKNSILISLVKHFLYDCWYF